MKYLLYSLRQCLLAMLLAWPICSQAAQTCATLEDCYANALANGVTRMTVVPPHGNICSDPVGCTVVEDGQHIEITPLHPLGATRLAYATPYGGAVLRLEKPLPIRLIPAQINDRGVTIALRLLRRDQFGPLPAAGAIFTAYSEAAGSSEAATLEFGIQANGAFYIGRRNGWAAKSASAPFYSFDLWEPDPRHITGDVLTVIVRFEPTGQIRVDALASDDDGLTWDQGLLETGYPLKSGSYPYSGDRLPADRKDNFAAIGAVSIGPGVISAQGFGAASKLTLLGSALTDDELIAIFNTEYAGMSGPKLSLGQRPCNTGNYLNTEGLFYSTPCGELTPFAARDFYTDGPYFLNIADAFVAVDGAVQPGARTMLVDEIRDPASLWATRTAGYNQFVFRKNELVLASQPGTPYLTLQKRTGSPRESFEMRKVDGVWQWYNVESGLLICVITDGTKRYLGGCQRTIDTMLLVKGPPEPPVNLRAFPSVESVALDWTRPSTFPGTRLAYEVNVNGQRQITQVPQARAINIGSDTELNISVRAFPADESTNLSPPTELRSRTMKRPPERGPLGFEYCARDGEQCEQPMGTYVVAYGASGRYSYRIGTGTTPCTASAFSSLPGGGYCYFVARDRVPVGPPGTVFCGRRGERCVVPKNWADAFIYYGSYGRFLTVKPGSAVDFTCEAASGAVEAGRDDACFYGLPTDRLQCANGPVALGGTCSIGADAGVRLAYYGTDRWFVTRPFTTSIQCTAAAFGLKQAWDGTPSCWSGRATSLPLAPPGMTFCAMEGQACPPDRKLPLGFTRLSDRPYNSTLAALIFVNSGGSDMCENRFGYPANAPGIGACFRLAKADALQSAPYRYCVDEGHTCHAGQPADSFVSYGIRDPWGWRVGTTRGPNVRCNNESFGDPARGKDKKCWVAP